MKVSEDLPYISGCSASELNYETDMEKYMA